MAKISNAEQMRNIIGDSKMDLLVALMGGKLVRIPKKNGIIYKKFMRRPDYYVKLGRRVSCELLGCSRSYFKRLRMIHRAVSNL